ncbi:hypothetical protein FQN57_000063 [Myotisia sp. PD_48]|nr:hypothetical protein FQN57_000063 [Myotisia sp. PD_48]
MKTRSKATSTIPDGSIPGQTPVNGSQQQSYKSLILPSNASVDARFVQLNNPRTRDLTRYFFCPTLGLFEFTSICSPSSTPRSLLFVRDSTSSESRDKDSETGAASEAGLLSKNAQLHVATPIDIVFFILPILVPPTQNNRKNPGKTRFQPLDDLVDVHDDVSPHLRYILADKLFRPIIERRIKNVCDTVEVDEIMFRFNEDKFVEFLTSRAQKMVGRGLPPTLERRYVSQALELPVLSIKREELPLRTTGTVKNDETNGSSQNRADSQASSGSPETTASNSFSAAPTSESPATTLSPGEGNLPSQQNATPEVSHLIKVRTALSFLQSSYLPSGLSARVDEIFKSPSSPINFKPLVDHLELVVKLRAEAQASRQMYNMSGKRHLEEDEDTRQEKAETKRRKQEEEKKKRANESRAVREIRKVDTSGMKKMTSFFTKQPKK